MTERDESTHVVEAINFRDRVACEPFDGARNAAAVDIFNEAMKKASAALAAAETSPGDVVAVLRKCRDYIASDIRMSRDEDEKARRDSLVEEATAAANRLDVRAEAKSQEPDAVAAWADSLGSERPIDAEAMKHLRNNPTTETYWSRFSIPLYTHPTTKPPAVSVDAIIKVRSWLATECCSDPLEVIDDALIAAGITEVPCPECDGAGEWDEGPLPATSSAQISPDYRQVKCPECSGSGRAALIAGERERG